MDIFLFTGGKLMKKTKEKPTTKICKHCRSEIDINAKRCPNCTKKQGGKGKFIILGIIVVIIILVVAIGLFGDSDAPEPEEVVYIESENVKNIYTDPDSYRGKYVKLTGKVFNVEKDGDEVFLQIWHDVDDSDDNTVIKYNSSDVDIDVSEDDYISVDGYISGTFSGSNALGGTVTAPKIIAKTIEKISYLDAASPTLKSINVDKKIEKDGYMLTLKKIEFAEKETRCYFTFKNSGSETFYLNEMDAKAKQGSKQFEVTYNYEAEYEELQSETLKDSKTSGIILFEAMDPGKDLTIYISGFSGDSYDDYDFEYNVSAD